MLNRIEPRLVFSQFGLLRPNTKTKLQSQNVSKCLKIYRARKKKWGGFWKILVWGMFLLDTLVKKNEIFLVTTEFVILVLIVYIHIIPDD